MRTLHEVQIELDSFLNNSLSLKYRPLIKCLCVTRGPCSPTHPAQMAELSNFIASCISDFCMNVMACNLHICSTNSSSHSYSHAWVVYL